MTDHVSTLRIDLTGNLSAEAKLMGEALLKAMADAKKLDEQLEQSGASKKMQDKLRNLGAGAQHVEAVTAALKAYKTAEDQAAAGGDWTREQINGLKSLEQTSLAVIRNRLTEEKQAHAQAMKLREEEAAAAKRFAEAEIAERRRVTEQAERDAAREVAARQRAHERELAEQRRHDERLAEQRREAQHRLGFGHYVAGSVVAGVSAHGVVSGIERAAEAGSELQDTRLTMQRAGVDAEMRSQLEQQALQLSARYANVGQIAIMDLQKEARSVLRDQHEVFGVTEILTKAKAVLDAGGGHSEGLGMLVKGAESIGAANDPERLAKLIDGYVKAIQVMGTTINPEQIYEFDKYAKSAGATMSDRFLMTTGLSLSQEMGGSTAANDIFQAQKDITGGFNHKHQAMAEAVRLGLIDRGDVKFSKLGLPEHIKAGHKGVKNAAMAQTDLDSWVYQTLLPALEKAGYGDLQSQTAEVSKMFTGSEANVITKLIQQRESFENHAKMYGGAAGVAGADRNSESASAGISAVTAALGNLMANVTVEGMAPVGKVLYTVADGLNALAQAAKAHPDLALGGGLVAGGAALYGAGKLGQMAMNGFGFGGGAAAAAEQTTAAGTQVTAAEMQLRAAGIEAEAAAVEQGAARQNAASGAGKGGVGGGAVSTLANALMLKAAADAARDAHALDAPKRSGFAGAVEFLDPGLADRIYGRNLPESRVKDDAYVPPAPPTSTLSPESYWRKKNAYLHRSAFEGDDDGVPLAQRAGFSRASLSDSGDGVDRGPVEGQAPDRQLMLAVAAGTEEGVLAAFAKMKGDGTGPNGLTNASLEGGGFGGGLDGSPSGGGLSRSAPSIRYGRQHSGAGGGGDVGGSATAMGGDEAQRRDRAMAKLMGLGWTREAAAAAIGNAQQESGIRSDGPLGDTARFGFGDDAAHGMFQWRGSRFRALEAFAAKKGTGWKDFDTQVEFFNEESRRYGSAGWRQSHDVVEANRGMQRFEGYGDKSFGTRLANARQILAGKSAGGFYAAAPGGSGPGLPGGGSAPAGDAAGLALSLQGQAEAGSARALGHIMHAGEWCADFVNGVIEKSGGKGSGSAMAASFANWGKAVQASGVKRGDVILENAHGGRINHVGMATGNVQRDKAGNVTAVEMVSGNYGHIVRKNWERMGIIAGLRRGNEPAEVAQRPHPADPVVPRTRPKVRAGAAITAGLDGSVGIFDHSNTATTVAHLKEVHRLVAGLGDASVSVLSGPRGANRGQARADMGRRLRGAPASTGTRIA